MNHVKEVFQGQPVEEYHCWVDSTTVLYWIKGQGTWTQFVHNRTQAIQDKGDLKWHYVPTSENPSDQGSRDAEPRKLGRLWFEGPNWLSSPDKWPSQPEVCETSETVAETVKPTLQNQMLAKEEKKDLIVDELLHRYSSYWKLLRVTAYVKRFVNNCRETEKQKGPLKTEELQAAERFWITQAQAVRAPKSGVNLERDEDGILRCVSRVPGYYPNFLPRECELTSLVVQQVHKQMLHGGVSVTMCRMREKFWVPKLRSLTKKVIQNCNVCKRYREKPISASHVTTAALPTFRVEMSDPFAVTGVDFPGPVYYRVKKSVTAKAYIALFTCTSTCAVHLKLCRDLFSAQFQRALKEFIARRGCPQTLVSDNGKTFVATGKWLSTLKKDHNLASYIGALNIRWKFNLARAPWWGGFFERLIGIMKRALSKAVGQSLLTYPELEDVLIDIENCMNNRPLLYQGEEFEQPVLTPNNLLRGKPTPVLEEDLEAIGEEKVSRRMKFLQRSKEQLRRRFLKEYVHALGERKSSSTADDAKIPETGAVVLLKGEARDRALWKLGRVLGRITGRDGVVRGLKLRQGNGYVVEGPLQLVCNLEIGGENPDYKLNPEAEVFVPRVKSSRRTKEIVNKLFKDIAAQEVEDGD